MILESEFAKSSNIFDSIDKISVYRVIITVLGLGFILMGCLVILKPFFPALLLATIFSISTWPAFIWLKGKLYGRQTLAAVIMTLGLGLCFLTPIFFLATNLSDDIGRLFTQGMAYINSNPRPPAWLNDIPGVGHNLEKYLLSNPENKTQLVDRLTKNVIAVGAALGRGAVDISIGVLFAFFFFCHGTEVARQLRTLIQKFAGPRGQRLLLVSKNTMISVVYGILGTALAQGGLAIIGFWIAGVPAAPLLGLVTFFLSFIPIGPPLIWVPASIWLFSEGNVGMGIFMAIWGFCAISAIDNIVRPYFISMGSNLPFLMVLIGVLGGIAAFGFIGLFIGPTLLALGYTLVTEWSDDTKKEGLILTADS